MKIPALPFTVTDWSQVAATTHPGETGQALWRTLNIGDLRIRMVEYSPGYLADHWCDRGHVLYVLQGELDTELRDGRTFRLLPGMSYQVSDFGNAAHGRRPRPARRCSSWIEGVGWARSCRAPPITWRIRTNNRHSGARAARTRNLDIGLHRFIFIISRFRVWSFGPSRNDGVTFSQLPGSAEPRREADDLAVIAIETVMGTGFAGVAFIGAA